ncbi:recombinase family protein [Roseobacter weihaiensis]|uniref:recombinase family protein n=1 Tax=Roseobacter weihaiensis TaxID=2763262 RepID=UPI001D0A0A2A|nr:recombinase family protein [Roseobacter sp. H9]
MTHEQTAVPALIYCRVSSKKQTAEGAGLESQEHRCRQYAETKGYNVEAVFPDDVSGGGDFMKRPGMVALLSFLDAQPGKKYVIIFDDLKRLARDTSFHLKLRKELAARNARPECLNFKFADTPEGEFIETILAAQGELERKQIGRQTAQKMLARIEAGYWVFRTIPSYRYKQTRGEGKLLVRDEPVASIVQEAFEGFASGRFPNQVDVQRFLEAQPEFPKQLPGCKLRLQKVTDILTHPLYAGDVQAVKWNVASRKGRHEPLVSRATFNKVQRRIAEGARAPRRANIGDDFALRGYVCCDACEAPLRSCYTQGGSGGRYAYYLCHTKGCSEYGKSIRREQLEGEFETLLKSLRPAMPLYRIVRDMFWDAWEQRNAQSGQSRKSLANSLRKIESQIDTFVDRIGEASSPAAIAAYERKISALEEERLLAEEKLTGIGAQNGGKDREAKEKIELSLAFLANPWKLWETGDKTLRKLVLRLTFLERLRYCRSEGHRTPQVTVPFTFFEISGEKCQMVPRRG